MKIRIATEDDLNEIDLIYNQAIEEKFTADMFPFTLEERKSWFKKHTPSTYPVFVNEIEKNISGWISFSPYRYGRPAVSKTVEISYYVHRLYRRKGVGENLISFAKEEAGNYGFDNLLAIILERNEASKRLIEKCGLKQWGYLPCVADFDGDVCGHFYYGINL